MAKQPGLTIKGEIKMPHLKGKQERSDLFRKNKNGDLQARDELFSLNLPLVHAMIKRVSRGRDDYDDLFQEGCLGLLKALQNFDPDRGTRFSTYAVPFIMGEIRSYLRKSGSLTKISRSYYEHYIQLLKNQRKMEQELQRAPRMEELAEKMGMEREEIAWLMELQYPPASLQEKSVQLEHPELGEDKILNWEDIDSTLFLKEQLINLPYRERQVIVFRHILGKTQAETAQILHLSQSHISRLEREILAKLKDSSKGD